MLSRVEFVAIPQRTIHRAETERHLRPNIRIEGGNRRLVPREPLEQVQMAISRLLIEVGRNVEVLDDQIPVVVDHPEERYSSLPS